MALPVVAITQIAEAARKAAVTALEVMNKPAKPTTTDKIVDETIKAAVPIIVEVVVKATAKAVEHALTDDEKGKDNDRSK